MASGSSWSRFPSVTLSAVTRYRCHRQGDEAYAALWVIFDHLRPSGHIMPDHAGDRGAVLLILAPHDHLHVKHERAFASCLRRVQLHAEDALRPTAHYRGREGWDLTML